MPQSNVIVNGSFDLGNTGWTGTDLETNYTENAYLGNGSGNRVAEMDGRTGFVTVMAQSVTVGKGFQTDLTFSSALRNASNGQSGQEGFRVDVLDSTGNVIATQTFLPTSNTFTNYAMPVTFPDGGTYTIRLTEVGPDNSLGAIIDNVGMLVCFGAGTLIDTQTGPRAVESLVVGDLVWTLDGGLQRLRWIGRRRIGPEALQADATLRPIVFDAGGLGPGLPDRPLTVSPQHRLCVGNWKSELYFGHAEVLVPAKALVNGTSIRQGGAGQAVTYVHFLLDGHQIVRSNGVLSESFFPTALALTGLDGAAQAELLRLFPGLSDLVRAYPRIVRPALRLAEARLVA